MSDSLWPHELQHTRPSSQHQHREFTQIHVHRVSDAIQPSHPLSSPSPPAPNPSQHQGLYQWVNSLHEVAKVLEFQLQHQSFPAPGSFIMSQFFASGGQSTGASASASVLPMNIQDWFPWGLTGWIPLQSKGLSRVFSIPQFKSINSSVLSFLYSPTLTSIHDYWKNHSLD